MKTYENSATVEEHGHVHVVGVLFAAGTAVEVIISPLSATADARNQTLNEVRARMRKLFATIKGFRATRLLASLDKARNNESVGKLQRAELYERGTR